ncbi:PKD domain-containing protein [Prevotella sp. E13-27]|uniref:PKD domain-containing protein n=1 Tax=Prevotella sp. E13-27 TaxID=2938122 RepID=UPI00200A22EA|nr:PKD domain-containing protein [Prevotella sp. E13-27]MCK8621875.1 PKD domain-containing protein [Prevotella sp. E13-27]
MKILLLSLLTFFALNATARDIVKVQRVAKSKPTKPTAMSYQATKGSLRLPGTIRRAAANGLTANFSVQTESAYVTVWNENFDSDDKDAKGNLIITGWTIDKGEGDAITFKKKQDTFNTIDENDVYSLFIEGPYQAFKRTKASATSTAISVPANGQLHAYIKMNPTWNSYVTLALQISADDFTTTEEVWNSKTVTEGKAQWVPITADLSAYAGKQIKIRIYWGPGTNDTFNTGGYMGDFCVDGLSITGVGNVDQIKVKAGDPIQFVDLTTGKQPTRWQWQFPGGTPETSNEQNPVVYYEQSGLYDVVLKAFDAEGSDEVVKTAFVEVEGEAPVAGVQFPADFRTLAQPRMRMVAPLAPVNYGDDSTGFPTSFSWALYTPYDLAKQSGSFLFQPDTIYTTKDVTYCHNKLDKTYVMHIAQNAEGYDFVDDSVQVQFAGFVSNFQPKDGYQTNFVDGDLTLPGANKMGITAWAERISKPSVPVVLEAMYVNFTKASAAALTDQISPVSFTLYTSENGLPGQPIELLDSWNLSELNYAMNTNNGVVTIELGRRVVIDKEVFLVIDGIPEKNDSMECAIAMAPMRNYGNTAFMLNKGQWRPFTGYFQPAPGGQTSLAVIPYFSHSVLIPAKVDEKGGITMANDTTLVPATAGKRNILVFANQGIYKYLGSDADWCRVTGKPGEYTVDSVSVEFDELPAGVQWREAVISVTDSIQTLNLVVRQDRSVVDAIQLLPVETKSATVERFDMQGRRIENARQARGIYLERRGNTVRKVMKR